MKSVEADCVEANFDEVLMEVINGETITITRQGVPVARFTPAKDVRPDAAAAIRDWQHYRRARNLRLGDDVTIRELIEEGRV